VFCREIKADFALLECVPNVPLWVKADVVPDVPKVRFQPLSGSLELST